MKDIERQLEEFTGDKRSKEYRDLKDKLESLRNDAETSEDYVEEEEETLEEEIEVLEEELEVLEEETNKEDFNPPVPTEIFEKVNAYKGKIPREDVEWFFNTYNEIFGTNIEKCRCRGKVSQMRMKILGTYNKYTREYEKNNK